MMGWKNLQDWAQRVWAKHYQQSLVGSTQNVKPVIVQDGITMELMSASSQAENSPSDRSIPTNDVETSFTYPTHQHAASTNGSEAAAQPAIRSSLLASSNEVANVSVQAANHSSFPANQSGSGSGHMRSHGDSVNKLSMRNQSAVNKGKKSRCKFEYSFSVSFSLQCTAVIFSLTALRTIHTLFLSELIG